MLAPLRCASDMHRAFSAYSAAHAERPLAVHIGVHTGEAMEEDDDFLGHTVIVASRIADVARSEEFSFVHPREVALKGLTRPLGVVDLDWAG